MYLPKSDIYSFLKELRTIPYDVKQASQNVFTTLPAVTYKVSTNKIRLDLDNEIDSQNIEIIVDIWSEDSVTASNVLNDVEKIMRTLEYRLDFSSDIVDPSGLFHINSRFKAVF